MAWQDFVLTAGQFLFIFALFPSVFSKDKPALTTSLLTGSVLVIFAVIYSTLHLLLTAATTSITAAIWFLLAYQRK